MFPALESFARIKLVLTSGDHVFFILLLRFSAQNGSLIGIGPDNLPD